MGSEMCIRDSLECLTVVVREHADHLRFAQRDLAKLAAR